jgi:putative addiction module component (TIGR02574 family)
MSQSNREFLNLSVAERIQLAEDIWDSIATENPSALGLTPAQRQEIQQRIQAHELNPGSAISWEQIRSELFLGKQ